MTELMTEVVSDRCFHAAVHLYNGKTVAVDAGTVRQWGIHPLMGCVSEWLKYQCMREVDDLPCEAWEPSEYRVWAEALPGGGVRFHGKRIS